MPYAVGIEHEETLKVSYLLNDLEISLQLGHFEFGDAKPKDLRTKELPFSGLSMHDKALTELQRSKYRVRPATHHGATHGVYDAAISRPTSPSQTTKLRNKGRLQQSMAANRRPITAPMRLESSRLARAQSPLFPMQPKGYEPAEQHLVDFKQEDENRSGAESPQSFCSVGEEEYKQHRSHLRPNSVLGKYSRLNSAATTRKSSNAQKPKTHTYHKCVYIGPHDIHPKLQSTTIGPNSTIHSVIGYIRPDIRRAPLHQTALYHQPNSYRAGTPHLDVWSPSFVKKRFMREKSLRSPLKSRFITSNMTYAVQQGIPNDDVYY